MNSTCPYCNRPIHLRASDDTEDTMPTPPEHTPPEPKPRAVPVRLLCWDESVLGARPVPYTACQRPGEHAAITSELWEAVQDAGVRKAP